MIKYDRFTLDNGLKVIVHEDHSTPLACINILYNVGAKDESEDKTGFAHLFEHLMFGGSVNIPSYDEPLQMAGGDNNAFTNNDITNYYLTIPGDNLETGFWLESDRMMSLAFNPTSLDVQRNVVMEEFKERYLNTPYGDAWLLFRPLSYKVHPYKWPTIGKSLKHIEDATLEDVKDFFYSHYLPNNAIMVVAGNVKLEQVKALAEKWFAPIPKGKLEKRNLPVEPTQTEARKETVKRDVPYDALYISWHTVARTNPLYYCHDLISDILGSGQSGRLKQKLVKENPMFSNIDCYLSGELDPGLIVIEGKLVKGVKPEDAEKAIYEVLEKLANETLPDVELQKVKNKVESTHTFSEMSVLNKAMNLAFSELLGNADLINHEIDKYMAVSAEDIKVQANNLFKKDRSNTLVYLSNS